ncbi:glycoside hydrolase family 13 protein [Microbulbifer thermotolerans]|uniref:glycoside hydrolase family 13 protein n=1 Tax=Microbulbifer thermotolerans TaxID=252514 RepID=UPI00224B02B2|nr:glycoside hydrolase family 13 protein [Microbulbifer thermotolerans]MCX2842879.1 glycoside hydrolase family 13 protein [Microbulbifer thermotolerans]
MKRLSTLLLALACASTAHAETTVDRIEPPSWWTGMAVPVLQLMLHGDDIAELEAQIDHPGVTLLDTQRTENPNYLFINLQLSPEAKPGQMAITLFHRGETEAVVNYQLNRRTPGSAERRGFDATDAIYLITPDRFANGNPANDRSADMLEGPDRKHPGGRHGGDIAGMRAHLDYIADMGFTQIWPNPLLENNQPAYSYHGYSATDHYRIDPRFGSNEDFREFVTAAREKGLGVIQDVVLNHIGDHHWWMRDLPAGDWLNGRATEKNGYRITNHARFTHVDPYASEYDKEGFTKGWFVDSMPDLNQRNPLVANYLIQNSLWWIEYAGLSGIRADTYAYSDADFLQQWAARIRREYPNFNIVGEEWTRNPALVAHWQRSESEPVTGGRLKSMMDFPIFYALREGLAQSDSWESGLTRLYEGLANDFLYPQPNRLVIFGGNHDTSRLFSALDEDPALFKMAVAYIATMRGIPQFFYGDEILMRSPKQRDDGIVRSDFPGGWADDKRNAFTGKGLSKPQKTAQDMVRKLFSWRKQTPAVHSGKLKHFAPENGTYVYFRYDDKKKIMVAINKSDQAKKLDMKRFAEVIDGETHGTDVISGRRYTLANLPLPARDVLVLELH